MCVASSYLSDIIMKLNFEHILFSCKLYFQVKNLRFISVIFFPAGGKNQCNIISQNERVTY